MRTRWMAAVGGAVLGVGMANAQPVPSLGPSLPVLPAPAPPAAPASPTPTPLPPPAVPPATGQLPPLLPVPQPPGTPLPEVPRPGGPPIEYDHGYQYLPERLPERSRRHPNDEACGPDGRWWIIPSLNLSWASTQPAPGGIRLRVPNSSVPGGVITGPRLPVGGLDAGRFEAALGLVVGRWFGETNTHGIEASAFFRDANTTFEGLAPGMLVFFPGGVDRSAPQVVVLPNGVASQVVGSFPATLGTYFATADVNYRHKLVCTANSRLDVLAGYRYAFLEDELYLGELPADGRGHDAFRLNRVAVSNSFHAGQIGLAGEVRANGWYVSGSAKMAFGVVTPEVTATGLFLDAQGHSGNGFRRLNALTAAGQSEFAVMPSLGVQVGRQLGNYTRLFAGYSFNYLSRAGRLGDVLNPANAGLPLTDFWTQSISFGGEFRF